MGKLRSDGPSKDEPEPREKESVKRRRIDNDHHNEATTGVNDEEESIDVLDNDDDSVEIVHENAAPASPEDLLIRALEEGLAETPSMEDNLHETNATATPALNTDNTQGQTAENIDESVVINSQPVTSNTRTPTGVSAASSVVTPRVLDTSGFDPLIEAIDLEAAEQQVIQIPDDEIEDEIQRGKKQETYRPVTEYRCPICMDPPETALIAPCGHVFCCDCLFQMVNSSRTYRKDGHCALCRKEVRLRDVKLIILRKKRIKKVA
ncbi:hypothetical protein NCAS_0A14550 [Naumovozyma castellii]|uniref:RING-type domain-containing protein n=1 Tax=Naumovozyma castellii TaxID=27288 RepID=G0V963_NAUCA|nr:hypothetical protein NCAS_0A14550 [Naumovozyma castellii CBS 4309]CCC68013.1 hypothetical protein NCAS_0A14550 [Naumovozyma castellii CBS 4309]